MKRVVMEGTPEQIQVLKNALGMLENTNLYKGKLPQLREDYQTGNLWNVNDAQSKFDCDESEALELIESALTNEATMSQIWFAIDFHAEEMNLERLPPEDGELCRNGKPINDCNCC